MKHFLEKYHIGLDDKLVIACSGGADSMFLLCEVLGKLPKSSIIVAHFNHELRGDESDRDESFVRDFCAENTLQFECGSADIKMLAKEKKVGLEEMAREMRYAFLDDVRVKNNAKYTLTAHHLDDSIETFIFNMLRGTKLTGLSGISEKNNRILRPLLHLQKKDILTHCETEKIRYITDSTNTEETLQRNYIRHSVVPLFENINPSYPRSIDRLMRYFAEIQTHLNAEILGIIHENYFLVDDFLLLPVFLRKELLRHLFDITNHGTIGLTEGNLEELERFVRDAKGGTVKEIKLLKLTKRQRKITFDKRQL